MNPTTLLYYNSHLQILLLRERLTYSCVILVTLTDGPCCLEFIVLLIAPATNPSMYVGERRERVLPSVRGLMWNFVLSICTVGKARYSQTKLKIKANHYYLTGSWKRASDCTVSHEKIQIHVYIAYTGAGWLLQGLNDHTKNPVDNINQKLTTEFV